MHPNVCKTLLGGLLAAGAAVSAQAGTLTYQGVDFTTSWTGNVLTLEIDAAHPGGDWASATTIGALGLKDLGNYTDVALTAAPGGVANWTLSSQELGGKGCVGGRQNGTGVCLSGPHVALTDDMLFQFTFTGGAVDLAAPLVKVNFFAGNGSKKVGDLLGQHVVATVPEPGSFAMMGLGMVMLGALGKKRRKQSART